MKNILFFSFIVIGAIITGGLKPAENYMALDQAVKTGHATCDITVNTESTHYIKPLQITIKNIKSEPLNVKVPNGFQFFPEEEAYQNLIITQDALMALNPGKSITIPLYAMCTEKTDMAPSAQSSYKIGKQADEKVTALTRYLDKNKLHDPLGQSAVWAMTSGTPLEDISGFDTTAARELVKYVAHALNKPVPPPPAPDDTRRNYYSTTYTSGMRGNFNYTFHKTTSVTIAMFNMDNIVVRELYRNPQEKAGTHKLHYEFDATEYTDDFYYMRLIGDGEIILSGKIDNRDDFNQQMRN